MRIVAIDPLETVDIDFHREALLRAERLWTSYLDRSDLTAPLREAGEAALSGVRDELAKHEPGKGPTFTVGMIPGEKRATVMGLIEEAEKAATAGERQAAEHRWRRAVVRASVRGHAGLMRRDGSAVPFDSVPMPFAGQSVSVPSELMLEVYAGAGIIGDLAGIALDLQRLGADEKNG